MRRISAFIKKNTVFCIALAAAVITAFFVPPDGEYLSYFDLRTLTCLFVTLAVICALKNIRFFTVLARRIVRMTGNLRGAILAVVYITFIGSMIIANDMALITFLPLGYYILRDTGNERYMAFLFTVQTIAANLGGMLTPFGNPQNLYLYSYFAIPNGEFMRIMVGPFALATLLVTLCCLFLPLTPLSLGRGEDTRLPPWRTAFYLLLFALAILMVFRLIPYPILLVIVPVALFFADRKALGKVDYGLLGTFTAFFIFSGNMARIPQVNDFFSGLLEKNTLLFSALSCQLISNVPSAILLSRFTEDYAPLLVGVNVGGTGTLIASLASLITFREYTSRRPGEGMKYLGIYSLFSFGFLAILLVASQYLFL